ncbi:hypothetical protein B296_00007233 [Ensete ventricosum]|uniref:Uncharacterized protein n=1 Tax=Ensete ventricosum TaxID=4639 RepID=A0A426YQV0_ENSVE|nr:hypothetical protein B296_00007233 [Ensete ventricosum]
MLSACKGGRPWLGPCRGSRLLLGPLARSCQVAAGAENCPLPARKRRLPARATSCDTALVGRPLVGRGTTRKVCHLLGQPLTGAVASKGSTRGGAAYGNGLCPQGLLPEGSAGHPRARVAVACMATMA